MATLVRLSAEKIVVNRPNRGFFVLDLTLSDLEDLTVVRTNSDSLALRLAIERGDLDWETQMISALHRVTRIPRRVDGRPSDEWASAHRAFHLALVAGYGIALLLEQAAMLFDYTELYRRWTAPPVQARDVNAEHARILDAARSRSVEAATAALAEHDSTSLEVMRNNDFFAEAERQADAGRRRGGAEGSHPVAEVTFRMIAARSSPKMSRERANGTTGSGGGRW